nr:alpha/beta hydrolase [Candidatus Sigynarchaeota archaeon]
MVVLDEAKFLPPVQKFIKMDGKRFMNQALIYCIKKRLSVAKLKNITSKLATAGDIAYKSRTMDLEKIGIPITQEEMKLVVDLERYVTDKISRVEMRKYKIPKAVRFENVVAKDVQAEWQIVPGATEGKVLFYIHGGGLFFYSAVNYRAFTVHLALNAKVRVLSVDYRLYPEHKHPSHIDDVLAAYTWLLSTGIDPKNVIVGGDSAGGLLVMRLLTRLRDEGRPLPAGAFCLSPMTDLTFSSKTMFDNMPTDSTFGTSGAFVLLDHVFKTADPSIDPKDPAISPVFAKMAGLPPLLFQATPMEMLFDDSRQLVEKAKKEGVDVTFQTWDGLFHVFQAGGLNYFPEALEANRKIVEFITQHLA